MATVTRKPGTPQIADPAERTAVEEGVRHALSARPAGESWAFSVTETHGDKYEIQLERAPMSELGPGLVKRVVLSPAKLHTGQPVQAERQHVTEAVQEAVQGGLAAV